MKKEIFETSKGRFIVKDLSFIPLDCKGIKLSEITEEQASEIVDKVMNNQHFQNYNFKSYDDRWVKTAIESLHSLLKSKGIHLFENPYTNSTDLNSSFFSMQEDFNKEKEAEQKTFYNPYIFKL